MHKAKFCIITCMDFRFQDKIQKYIKNQGWLGSCDEIIIAGASRDLVKPLEPFHKESIIRQINLSVKLHDPDEIIIIDHQDCGGYAQDQTILSGLETAKDQTEHKIYAKRAYEILKKDYPDKIVSIYYIAFSGEVTKLI